MAGWGRMGIDEAVVMAGDVEVVVCGVRRGWMMAVVCGYDVVVVGKVGMVMMAFGVRELLEYMDVHNNDASESLQPSWGKMVYIWDLIDFDVTISNFQGEKIVQATSMFQNLLKIGMFKKLRQKEVYEEILLRHAAWIGGKLIQLMHNTMVPGQVKTLKIQAGIQALSRGELRRQLQLWVPEQQYQLYLSMKNDPQLQQQDIAIWLALQMKFENLQVPQTTCRPSAVRPRDQDDPHDDAHPEGENRAKRQKTSEYEAYVSGESSSGQVNENEQGPSTSGNQEQEDDYDFWTESYASDDDEIPTKQMSQDIMEEVSLTIDEAKLKKMVDEMLRQRCTSGDEHQYHIDQMKNFLKSDIVWESRKEILVSPHPRKTTPLVQSCQRDPEAPPLSLINQDLLYLKKGSSGPEKIVLSLHKFPAIIFNDDDIEERTSRWVNKCVKKFNPYARYGVEHWKNPHAKIFYIRKQKEPGKPKEVIYSNSKIIQVIKTYWELGHEHKFITEIVARRANECIVSITEPNYKNLNKNDIEDMYLLIMNGKVPDYAETGLLWSLSVFIRSSVIWERVHDFQLGIESYQQKVNLTAPTIYFPGVEKHKIVLEGLRSFNNDVKYGYIQRDLTNDEVEYLKLFEEEIEVRLKYHNQMRRWEMYVNGRPLGPRRERPE
ncbi:hypothetical protein Tco_1500356 [Tanacetum coccineum]